MQVLHAVLCLVESGNVRVLCPRSLRLAVLERTHNKFGHLGVQATLQFIREGFYWVNLRQEVEHHIESCGVCTETRPCFEKPEDGTLVTSTHSLERLSLDFIGPKATRSGEMKWILTFLDEYSRYLEAFVVEHLDSETAIDVLSNQVFARFGLPNKVHSDRGKAFMSTEIQQFLDGCGVEISHSSKHNPAGNGQNERYNGELQRLITRILKENGLDSLDWEHCLGEALFILRSRVCESTGSSPHDLFFRFRRRYFADSDLKLLAKDSDFTMNKGKNQRGSKVFIRNFVRVKKTDPLVKDKGLVTDLLSPQLAEIRTPKGTEYVYTLLQHHLTKIVILRMPRGLRRSQLHQLSTQRLQARPRNPLFCRRESPGVTLWSHNSVQRCGRNLVFLQRRRKRQCPHNRLTAQDPDI